MIVLLKDQIIGINYRDIDENIIHKIKQKYKKNIIGKRINDGYILDVYSINDIDNAEDLKEETDKVKYVFYARVKMYPIFKKKIMTIKVSSMSKHFILGKYGSFIFTETNNYPKIICNRIKNDLKAIELGDYLKVKMSYISHNNFADTTIILGKVIDFASNEEIETYLSFYDWDILIKN